MPKSFSELFAGTEAQVPLLNARLQPYINLDNAAFTLALQAVQQAVDRFLIYYRKVLFAVKLRAALK